MTAVFVGMIVCAGAGVGVASSLAAYARRNWARTDVGTADAIEAARV